MYGDQAGLTSAAKLELVLAVEPELRQFVSGLEYLNKAQTALNSDHYRGKQFFLI
jgi:hypothetical protein